MNFHHITRHFVLGSSEKVAWAGNALREQHPQKNWILNMSTNNSKGITLGKRPIRGIHPPNLIFSWLRLSDQ